MPIFRNKHNLQYCKSSDQKELNVQLRLSKYANSDRYEADETIILQRDMVFYIDIYFTNNSSQTISNIELEIPSSDYMMFNIQPYNKHFHLQSFCDRIVQIKVSVINCIRKYSIPKIRIKYESEGTKQTISLAAGSVDPTHLTYFPLIGVNLNNFLKLTVEPILKKEVPILIL